MEEKYGHFRREERDIRQEREATMWRGRGLHPLPSTPQICIMVMFICKQTPRIRFGRTRQIIIKELYILRSFEISFVR